MIREVIVFTLEGDKLIVLDTEAKEELKVNVKGYDRNQCKELIGQKILIEELDNEFVFAGTFILRHIGLQ